MLHDHWHLLEAPPVLPPLPIENDQLRAVFARRDNETILIYGDYDVDGVTSIVLLQTVLRLLGADAAHVVPHRLVDGYGLKLEVLERVLAERDVRLVITVDCGITSIDPVRRAIELGIDVIITDHHLPPGTLPDAEIGRAHV